MSDGLAQTAQIRLDHVVIAVSDWDRSNAFYRDVVGAEVVPHGAGSVYRIGDVQLNVHGPGVSIEQQAATPVPPGGSDLCFEWAGSVDEATAHLARHGVAVEAGPVERHGRRGGGRSVYFRDPDGSLLELLTYA
jgi:catechol 2,3-dioxygenase-like lactoylglutathione lyase family enzyme